MGSVDKPSQKIRTSRLRLLQLGYWFHFLATICKERDELGLSLAFYSLSDSNTPCQEVWSRPSPLTHSTNPC